MPSRMRVTFAFNLAGIGGTETYVSKIVDEPLRVATIRSLLQVRNGLMAQTVQWAGVRIANADLKRRGAFYPPGDHEPFGDGRVLEVPSEGAVDLDDHPEWAPDQARSCMQIRFRYDTDRRVVRYLFGMPDSILMHEPGGVDFTQCPGFLNRFNAYRQVLIRDGWCVRAIIRARAEPPAVDPNLFTILNWASTAGPPALMGFVLPTTPPSGIVRTDFVRVVNTRRRGTDRVSYNGRYFVQAVVPNAQDGTTAYYLRGTEDGEPDSVKLPGQVFRVRYDFFPILQTEAVRVGVHKRGNVLGVPVGRRQRRASLDP